MSDAHEAALKRGATYIKGFGYHYGTVYISCSAEGYLRWVRQMSV